jgi:Ca-activated chloride channel family protein
VVNVLHHWFAHPVALRVLLVLPALGLIAALSLRWRRRALARWGNRPTLETLTAVRPRWRFLRRLARMAGLTFLILGIAGPQWGQDLDPVTMPGRDLIVVLDMSRSMLAQDVLGKSSPNRLGRARDALAELVDTVQRRGGHRLALVVFAARARVVCPLTHDYDHFRANLTDLDPANPFLEISPDKAAISGTRIGAGLREAVQARDPRFRGHQDILLLSDGDDPAHDDEWRDGLNLARKEGISVHTVGVGDPDNGSPIPVGAGGRLLYRGQPVLTRLEEKPLREIAEQTGGTYTPARTRALPLGKIFREQIAARPGREDTEESLPVYRQHSSWFFAAALGLLAVEMLLSDKRPRSRWKEKRLDQPVESSPARSASAPAVLVASVALALLSAGWAGEVERFVRAGDAAFENGDYAAAVDCYAAAEERTTDPGLVAFNKGAALYRLGRYREAELHYLRCQEDATGERRVRVLYDLGDALLQQAQDRDVPRLQRAIGCYDECLRLAVPGSSLAEDARFNLQLARALLAKAKAARDPSQPDNSNSNDQNDNPRDRSDDPRRHMGGDFQPGGADPGGRLRSAAALAGNRSRDPVSASQQAPPGVGNLPPIPDRDALAQLSPEDTSAYLEQVVIRVLRERREHKQRSAAPPPPKVMDW